MEQESKCSGRCKAMVLRIVEQVRAETEQWSQMQKMLEQVRGEMEELQASRDYWETRAHDSSCEIQSLRQDVSPLHDVSIFFTIMSRALEIHVARWIVPRGFPEFRPRDIIENKNTIFSKIHV